MLVVLPSGIALYRVNDQIPERLAQLTLPPDVGLLRRNVSKQIVRISLQDRLT